MKIVPNPQVHPNHCRICERTRNGDDILWVDTLKDLDTGLGRNKHNGRTYVCGICLDQMAKLAGYEHGSKVAEAQDYLEALRGSYREINLAHENLAELSAEMLRNLPVAVASPAAPSGVDE